MIQEYQVKELKANLKRKRPGRAMLTVLKRLEGRGPSGGWSTMLGDYFIHEKRSELHGFSDLFYSEVLRKCPP